MKKNLYILFILSILSNILSAQNIFQKVTGLGYPGNAQSFCMSADSTIVSTCSGSLIKTDSSGNLIWAKRYLAPGMLKKSKVISLGNGGYVILFDMILDGFGSGDVMVFNTNSEGLIQWIKYFGTDYADVPEDITELANGDFVIAGQANSFSHTDKDMMLMRMNKFGDQYWQRSYGSFLNDDVAHKLIHSAFGGFIISGDLGQMKCILRTDDNGVVKWCLTYGSGSLMDMVENPANGDLITCGYTTENTRSGKNIFVMKTDSAGVVLWSKKIGDDNNEIAYSINCSQDFSLAYIAGKYLVDIASTSDAFVACLGAEEGSIHWAKIYGSQLNDLFYDNLIYNANSLINIGSSECCDTTFQNIYMVKTTLDGISGCNEMELVPLIDSNLIIVPETAVINTDTGEFWVTSTCYPPNTINYQQLTLCTTESVDESSEPNFMIYPNPAHNILNINYSLSDRQMLELYNVTGSIIKCQYASDGSTIKINVENYPRGIYLIRISGTQQIVTQKFILD